MRVEALDQDFNDGLLLINLIELLTKKTVEKVIKAPKTVIHKIQNNGIALKAISEAGVMSCGCSAEGAMFCFGSELYFVRKTKTNQCYNDLNSH